MLWPGGGPKARRRLPSCRAEQKGPTEVIFLDLREADSGPSAESPLGEVLKTPHLRAKPGEISGPQPKAPWGIHPGTGPLAGVRTRQQEQPGLASGTGVASLGQVIQAWEGMGRCHLAGHPSDWACIPSAQPRAGLGTSPKLEGGRAGNVGGIN